MIEPMSSKFVVVGGGITAVCCAEQIAIECPEEEIVLIAGSNIVKAVSGWARKGKAMESFEVEEKPANSVFDAHKNIRLISAVVTGGDKTQNILNLSDGQRIKYNYLCIATGGKPLIISNSNFVLGIRDTQTVADFQKRLKHARRVLVVGNGGIATELVFELKNIDVVWVVKHKSIASTFVDAGAAEFFLPFLSKEKDHSGPTKRLKYTTDESVNEGSKHTGSALGPDWADKFNLAGSSEKKVTVEYECEVREIVEKAPESGDNWPIRVELSNSKSYGCDLLISATGVEPNTDVWTGIFGEKLALSEDGGITVDDQFLSSVANVYAAGDVCTAGWKWADHWLQMRLWTQARQMGAFCGHCMVFNAQGHRAEPDICFEIFTHVTTFFGFKVILLGRFNSQGLGLEEHEALLRVKKGEEYVKLLLKDGRVQGAILIGETDLEETMENLILNQTDISDIKDGLLECSVDIEDYFD